MPLETLDESLALEREHNPDFVPERSTKVADCGGCDGGMCGTETCPLIKHNQ